MIVEWFKSLIKPKITCPHNSTRWVMEEMGMSKRLICLECFTILKKI